MADKCNVRFAQCNMPGASDSPVDGLALCTRLEEMTTSMCTTHEEMNTYMLPKCNCPKLGHSTAQHVKGLYVANKHAPHATACT